MKKNKDNDLLYSPSKCAFCGRNENLVDLVHAPSGVCICRDCVDICQTEFETFMPEDDEINLLKPQEIKAKLDEYIVGQDEAKKVLSVAVYNHYKRVSFNQKNNEVELKKSNVLLLGPTGTGKTLLAQTLSRILNVPFAVADATTLTEAGYVGEDVENILLKLIQAADYDIRRAEKGIIYVDEIDKITRKGENVSITRDVSGEGVQQALLKIIESTVANVPPQGGRKHPQQECIAIDTTNILFIFGGAFIGLDKIIEKRTQTKSLGFGAEIGGNSAAVAIADIQPTDLIKYGLIPEFVGRVPVCVSLQPLDREALINILTCPKDALIKQYEQLLSLDDIKLEFTPEALSEVAEKAIRLKTGARGLRTIIEGVMTEIMYYAPSDASINGIVIDKACISGGKPKVLRREKSA